MESVTPKKFKSNVLAALNVKPDLGDLENYYPPLTQTKRKQTPGSPDHRQPKRVAAGIHSSIPGLENVLRGCPGVINLTVDLILLFIFSLRSIAATAINGGFTERSSSRVRYKLQ